MSRKYFFQKASNLSSEELLQILVDIDNGFFDKELDKRDWFDKMDIFREEMIEVLLRRYRTHYLYTSKKDDILEKAYSIYLRHYI